MPMRRNHHSPLPLAVALLFTLGFVGCLSDKQSLNGVPAGNGGEEGDNPASGSGGKTGAAAGTGGSSAHAGTNGMGTGGRSETGGGSGVIPRGGSSFAGSGAGAGIPNGGSAGSPNGGVPNAGAGAMAGYAGGFSGGGPMAGSAGGAGAPGCLVSSEDHRCDGIGFCVEHASDSCDEDAGGPCSGTCEVPYLTPVCSGFDAAECPRDFACLPDTDTASGTDPTSICVGGRTPECGGSADCADGFACLDTPDGKRCVPDRANCRPLDACDSRIPTCPPGYAPADAQVCDYVCVPFQHCGCEKDSECPVPSTCDHGLGRCLVPLAPPSRCLAQAGQPDPDSGPCAGKPRESGYAFIDGECTVETYNVCDSTENRFSTIEECISTCQGMPIEQNCRGNRKAAEGCLACGAGGGCMLRGQFCFEPCETSDDCTTPGYLCSEGICQVGGCL